MLTLGNLLIAMGLVAMGALLTLAFTFPRRGKVRAALSNLGRAYWQAMRLRFNFRESEEGTLYIPLTDEAAAETYNTMLRDILDSWRVLAGRTGEPPKPYPETITSRTGYKLVVLALLFITLPGCATVGDICLGTLVVIICLGGMWGILERWYNHYDRDKGE